MENRTNRRVFPATPAAWQIFGRHHFLPAAKFVRLCQSNRTVNSGEMPENKGFLVDDHPGILRSQCRGQGFDPPHLHQYFQQVSDCVRGRVDRAGRHAGRGCGPF